MPERYLSRPEVAERIGVGRATISKYSLPEPDAIVGTLPGWLPATIDAWHANRPGRGRWRQPTRGNPYTGRDADGNALPDETVAEAQTRRQADVVYGAR